MLLHVASVLAKANLSHLISYGNAFTGEVTSPLVVEHALRKMGRHPFVLPSDLSRSRYCVNVDILNRLDVIRINGVILQKLNLTYVE